MTLTLRLTVVLIGTLPKLMLLGLAEAMLTPLPWTAILIGRQLPPTTGHSNTVVVPLDDVAAVGEKLCVIVHVPGPVKPPPAPQVSKLEPERHVDPASRTRPPCGSRNRP